MKKDFKSLKKIYKKADISTKKYSKKEIDSAIKKWGTLPKTLIEYYETIGAIEDEDEYMFHVFPPSGLYQYEDGVNTKKKYLVFASEMQGAEDFAFALEDLEKDNPVLYMTGDASLEVRKDRDYLYVSGKEYDDEYGEDFALSLTNFVFYIATEVVGEEWKFDDEKLDVNAAEEKKRKLAEKAKLRELIWGQQKLAQEIISGKRDVSEITDEMIENVTEIDCSRNRHALGTISDISILSNFLNLKELKLDFNEIEDLSPIKELTKLTLLSLSNNRIQDISPLRNLKNLKQISLQHNKIKDISPIEGLIKLNFIVLKNNELENVEPIRGLLKLNYLNLDDNKIKDISAVSDLVMLEDLWLNDNEITDISPVKSLKRLKILAFEQNKVSDISMLSELKAMYNLTASNNPIKDVGVVRHMKDLQLFQFNNTNISDLTPLSELSKLSWLRINNTQVTNLSPIKNLENISDVNIANTKITQVGVLKSFKKLEYLDLRGTNLVDFGATPFGVKMYFPNDDFAENTYTSRWEESTIVELFLTGRLGKRQLDTYIIKHLERVERIDINASTKKLNENGLNILMYCTNLKWLSLIDIKMGDLKILKHLKHLVALFVRNTGISDLTPLINLEKLEITSLKGNKIKDITTLSQLKKLTCLDISDNEIEDITPIISLKLKHLNIAGNKLSKEIVKKETKLTVEEVDFDNGKLQIDFF